MRYRVATRGRGWYPPGTTVVSDTTDAVVIEAPDEGYDQAILDGALRAARVHEFTRVVPDLNDLFKEVVTQ